MGKAGRGQAHGRRKTREGHVSSKFLTKACCYKEEIPLLETYMTSNTNIAADRSETITSREDVLLLRVKRAAPDALNKVLSEANWQAVPLPVFEWVASRKGLCLTAALHGFFNADPMRFNYLHKNEVPVEYRALCRMLDALCLRMNSGFYDNTALCKGATSPEALENWLTCQKLDGAEGHVGRWVFKKSIFFTKPTPRERSVAFAKLADPQATRTLKRDWREELKAAARRRFAGVATALNQA